jgi:hypothetical protein
MPCIPGRQRVRRAEASAKVGPMVTGPRAAINKRNGACRRISASAGRRTSGREPARS